MTGSYFRNIALAGIIFLSVISVIADSQAGGVKEASVSFSRDIAPVLRRKCATCHLTGTEAGGMALHPKAAWRNLVGKASGESGFLIVAPGQPEKSYLIMKLEGSHMEHGGMGSQMPFGAPPLKPEIIQTIRIWISEGAANN